MSYTYHGTTDLIALPNRTVQTYPSGLVRVERSFVCRKDRVARFRNAIKVNEPMPFDDGAPAIDGIYIFPEPQEVVRDDGFVEFRVTAYGRTTTTGNLESKYIRGGIAYTGNNGSLDWYASSYAMVPEYLQRIVLQNEEVKNFSFSINAEILPASVEMRFENFGVSDTFSVALVPYAIWENYMMTGPTASGLLYKNTKFVPTGGVLFSNTPFSVKKRIGYLISSDITSTNFGIFNEYVITYKSFFQVLFTR